MTILSTLTDLAAGPSMAYFGSTLTQWTLFFLITGLGVVAGKIINHVYESHLEHRIDHTATLFDDVLLSTLGKPVTFLLFVVGATIGQELLTPTGGASRFLDHATTALIYIAAAWIVLRFADAFIKTYVERRAEHSDSKLDDQIVPILHRIVKVTIFGLTFIVILDAFGYNVNAVIASLGIGGLAVAFAAKETIADIFGGFNIFTARPFIVGDAVEISDTTGKVEEIGLRYTRIRDFDGRLITMPNSDVASATVKNISSEPTRRVDMMIGLTYETTPQEMQDAINVTEETINSVPGVAADKTAVWFWEYGDSALQLKVKYFIEDMDNKFDIRSQVNQAIQQAYEEHGFEMAFPTRTVHVIE